MVPTGQAKRTARKLRPQQQLAQIVFGRILFLLSCQLRGLASVDTGSDLQLSIPNRSISRRTAVVWFTSESSRRCSSQYLVTPAKAGVHGLPANWIPAFAGMTDVHN